MTYQASSPCRITSLLGCPHGMMLEPRRSPQPSIKRKTGVNKNAPTPITSYFLSNFSMSSPHSLTQINITNLQESNAIYCVQFGEELTEIQLMSWMFDLKHIFLIEYSSPWLDIIKPAHWHLYKHPPYFSVFFQLTMWKARVLISLRLIALSLHSHSLSILHPCTVHNFIKY